MRFGGIIRKLPKQESTIEGYQLKIQPSITMAALLVLCIPGIPGMIKLNQLARITNASIIKLLIGSFAMIGVAFLVFFPLHEWLHGLMLPKQADKTIWFHVGNIWIGECSYILTSDQWLSRARMILVLILPNIILGVVPYLIWISGLLDNQIYLSQLAGFLILLLLTGFYADLIGIFHIYWKVPKDAQIHAALSGFYVRSKM